MQQPFGDDISGSSEGGHRQGFGEGNTNTHTDNDTRGASYRGIDIGDNARAHLGDHYLQNHGIIINSIGNFDLNDHNLRNIAYFDPGLTSERRMFGLCLGQAPQIDHDAFIGRIAELQQLKEWFGVDRDTQKVVSIVGMGGLGKTQLSLAYARTYKDHYTSVFWVNAKDELNLRQSFASFSDIIQPNTAISSSPANANTGGDQPRIDTVRRWLPQEWNRQWLIIFDNYDDPDLPNVPSTTGFDIRAYFPHRAQGQVLITTRSPKLAFSKRLMLQKFDNVDSSLAIVAHRADRDLKTDRAASSLAIRLDGLPLALAMAGVYLGQTGISCAEYLQAYESTWTNLYGPESEELFEYADRTLSSTWALSVDHVSKVDADAVELLKFWAYFNNKDVWYELVRNGASGGPAWMARITTSKFRFQRAMTRLRDYSLVEVAIKSYSIHACVHDWVTEHYEADETAFVAAVRCIAYTVPEEQSSDYWMIIRRLLTHVKRLIEGRFQIFWDESLYHHEILRYSFVMGNLLLDCNYFSEAEKMYMRALTGWERVLGYEHHVTITTVVNLGILSAKQGRLEEAEQMFRRGLAVLERTMGSKHPSTFPILHNLGKVFGEQGKVEQAEEMYLEVLREEEAALGPDHASTLRTAKALGILYNSSHRLREAEEMFSRVLASRQTDETGIQAQKIAESIIQILRRNAMNSTDALHAANQRVASLSRAAEDRNYLLWNSTYDLARALFWIGDDENFRIASSQVAGAICDGCNGEITSTGGHHVCRQCYDIDLCNSCMAEYKSNELTVNKLDGCSGHPLFHVNSSIPPSLKSLGRMDSDTMDAWFQQLEEKYPKPET